MRTRDEIIAEMAPIRQDIVAINGHLADEHGVTADDGGARTAPEAMTDISLGGWIRRHAPAAFAAHHDAIVAARMGSRGELGSELRAVLEVAAAEARATCDLDGCPGPAGLIEVRAEFAARRDPLRVELAELGVAQAGNPQTVSPRGLNVETLTGVLERARGG